MQLSVRVVLLMAIGLFFSSCEIISGESTITLASQEPVQLSMTPYLQQGQSAPLNITGGTPPYSVKILSGAGTYDPQTNIFSSALIGENLLQISDARGVTTEITLEIVQALSFIAPIGTLAASQDQTFQATGGSGTLTYSTTSPFDTFLNPLTGYFTRPWASGTLNVTATDIHGLSTTEAFTLAPSSLHLGSSGWDDAYQMAQDSQGNLFVITSSYDALPGYANQGNADIGVYKYNKNGQILSRMQFGSSGYDWAADYMMDSSGDLYLTYQASGSWGISPITGGAGCNLIKIKSDGTLGWVKTISSTVTNRCRYDSLVDGDSGYIYFASQATNSGGSIDGATPIGVQDNYVMKVNKSTGATQWIRFLGTVTNYYSGVFFDAETNSVYFSGVTDGALPSEVNTGGRDFYIVKYDSDGNRLWHDQWGHADGWSHYWSKPFKVGTNMVYCGVTGQTWPNSNYYPVILIYNASGSLVFSKRFNEFRDLTSVSYPYYGCVKDGNSFVFNVSSPFPFDSFTASGGATRDLYYIKYDSIGTEISKHQLANMPARIRIIQTDGSMVGVIDSSADLAADGNSTYNTFLFKIASPGATPAYVKSPLVGTTTNHYWEDFFQLGTDSLFLMVSSDGTVDSHVNAGSNDVYIFKYNSSLQRQ